MIRVLLIGGGRDGDRITFDETRGDYIRLPERVEPAVFWQQPPSMGKVTTCEYRIERFQCGHTTEWVGYPVGTTPEHGLTMLMAGYVGNTNQ